MPESENTCPAQESSTPLLLAEDAGGHLESAREQSSQPKTPHGLTKKESATSSAQSAAKPNRGSKKMNYYADRTEARFAAALMDEQGKKVRIMKEVRNIPGSGNNPPRESVRYFIEEVQA